MTDVTMFLAKLMGPIYLIVAISIMMNKDWYVKLMKQLEANIFVYLNAIIALATGIAIVLMHNIWTSLPTTVISLLGWIAIAKGVFHILAPEKAIEIAKSFKDKLPLMSWIAFILGAYLCYIGYFQTAVAVGM